MATTRQNEILINLLVFLFVSVAMFTAFYFYCIKMPGVSFMDELPELDDEMLILRDRLSGHVNVLAGEIGERNYLEIKSLNKAAEYIEEQLNNFHYTPIFQSFGEKQYRNVIANLYGNQHRDEIIIVGAHYDSAWFTPGADDNASGVAALLEISRALNKTELTRTIRFVAFVNEEEPFYGTENMGSAVNAKYSYENNEKIVGMFSLEMLGYYSDEPNTQRYPRPLNYFYPDRANFVAFVSNIVSRKFLSKAIISFRANAKIPSEGLAVPEWLVPDIRRSDNISFWKYGFPAVMVTDTSNFRSGNYHKASDVPGTLDYERFARVVSGLTKMLESLANN